MMFENFKGFDVDDMIFGTTEADRQRALSDQNGTTQGCVGFFVFMGQFAPLTIKNGKIRRRGGFFLAFRAAV